MNRKKIITLLLLLFIIGFTSTMNCFAEDPWGEDIDPGGSIPLPGVLYFFIAALGVGAKKLYDARKRF